MSATRPPGALRVIRVPKPGPWVKVGMALGLLVIMVLGFVVYQSHRDQRQNSVIQALANGLGAEQRQAQAAGITPVAPNPTAIIEDPTAGASSATVLAPLSPVVTRTVSAPAVTTTVTTTVSAPPAPPRVERSTTTTTATTTETATATQTATQTTTVRVPGPVVVVTEPGAPVVVTEPAPPPVTQTVTAPPVTETATATVTQTETAAPSATPTDEPTSPGTGVAVPQPSAPSGEPTGTP